MSGARRLVTAVALAGVVTTLLGCAGVVSGAFGWWQLSGDPAQTRAQGPGSLPAEIGGPSPWTPDGVSAPVGAASVLYTSNTWFVDGSRSLSGLVGRSDDTYRVTDLFGAAGMGSVLSPDGERLAFDEGIADLATGRITPYQRVRGEGMTAVEAQAWSPDGTSVVLTVGEWPEYGERPKDVRLLIVDAATGATREIARWDGFAALPGWVVAFSPDGSRLAFHHKDTVVRVIDLAAGTTVDVPVPSGARLAGKGAWTRDGRHLLVVSGSECDCGDYPVRWTVDTIAVADGARAGESWTRDGVYALRVLGWWPSGRPVAVEYTPVGDATPTLFTDDSGQYALASQNDIGSARLIELGPNRELLGADSTGDVESLDVPDRILAAGNVRPGSAPLFDLDTLLRVPLTVIAGAVLILLVSALRRVVARSAQRSHAGLE